MTLNFASRCQEIAEAFGDRIVDRGKLGAFVVLTSFIITLVRVITHAVGRGSRLARNIRIADTHIHHLVPGIVLLIVSGYLAIAFHYDRHPVIAALWWGTNALLTRDSLEVCCGKPTS